MSDEPEEKAKPPKVPGPKAPKAVLLLLLVNMGATGFVAFQTMQLGGAVHAAAAAAVEHEPPKKHEGEVGPVVPLDPFIVNLNEPEASRYLKASFELEVVSADVTAQLEKLKRPIRDEVLRYLSSLSVADTQGEAGKAKIQKEVVARIDHLIGADRVKRLFFVEFMVQ